MLKKSTGLFALFSLVAVATGEDTVDFNRQIRPILADKCFQCHGPDEETLEGGLRLDLRDSATAEGAVIPGNAEKSELVARILTVDVDDVMPPAKVKKPVTKEEAELLQRWIDEGAEYSGHWAFEPVKTVDAPTVKNSHRVKNEIDRFILARLETKGLSLSPEAAPGTLARRLSLDLTGLLPAPDRVRSFIQQYQVDADTAVSDFVDELLASPHYGERWGRHWLDQARYADSNGYTIDGERVMWPYRDWVIRALNDDMPFDEFTIRQIAGDLLPDPDKATLVATGFHRNTLINQEGGTDDEQFRNEEVVDRVNTTGAVWLGLTLGCAQCHTHKFDPITHKEYFEMFAFFNQGTDVNNTGATVEVGEGEMFLKNPDPKLVKALEKAKEKLAKLEATKAARQAEWEKSVLELTDSATIAKWSRVKPVTFLAEGGGKMKLQSDDSILVSDAGPKEVYRVKLTAQKEPVSALRLRILPHESLPKNGPGLASNGNIVLTGVEFFQDGEPLLVKRAEHDHAQPGFSGAYTIDGDPETGWAINIGKETSAGVKMNAEHEIRFTFSAPVAKGKPVDVVLRHEKNANYNIGRFAWESSPTEPAPMRDESLLTMLRIDPAKRSGDEKKRLAAEFAKMDVERTMAIGAVEKARNNLGIGRPVKTMVMRDLEKPRETFIHLRGDFLQHDEKTGPLAPGVPAVLPKLPEPENPDKARTRLDLAHWLVREDHPLTPRVTVNRVWMRYFGRGIVETENDFGTQGTYPSHPELLDWLARRFVAEGWSMKRLHKLIVTSATYRQSSHQEGGSEIDPLNHLLSRQSRIRFEAEIVRDAALSASGLLHAGIGGPGVMPPQPEGVYAFTQRKVRWVAAENEDRYRRALYTKFYRSAPYPLLTTFDSPDFQSVCTGRVRSNTPLQSLTLANDEAMFELARGLGGRIMREVEGTDSTANRKRIRHAFQICFSRQPSEGELEFLAGFQELQEKAFAKDGKNAKKVVPKNFPGSFPVQTAASWTAVARILMNTDEFITRE
ncbi:MAG: PSD1 and planctomycete cytochrome C domain-containing protein [Verrucomicrobiales bacterium]|nr:PSD1 and planctomycete cytochrome C domain-containing protein [Verrucomicrobiales bacterium]